jgi:hypothetical protein
MLQHTITRKTQTEILKPSQDREISSASKGQFGGGGGCLYIFGWVSPIFVISESISVSTLHPLIKIYY